MENQHQKIKGYRDLSQAEIDLMNEVKAKGEELQALIDKVCAHIDEQYQNVLLGNAYNQVEDKTLLAERLKQATPERFVSMAKTELQKGLMFLTRAIAQPTHF